MSTFDELASLDPIQQNHTHLPQSSTVTQGLAQKKPDTDLSLDLQHPYDTVDTAARKRDNDIDKFATLFSPSTPRASPTFASLSLPDVEKNEHEQKSNTYRHHRTLSTSSQQSDFGAFVSVPAAEDPLSAGITSFEEEGLPRPLIATPTTATAKTHSVPDPPVCDPNSVPQPYMPNPYPQLPRPSSRASSSSSRPKRDTTSASLSFFDQFAHEARERSSTRSGVLDELLQHQDDPLYFLKNENPVNTDPVPASPSTPNHSSNPSEPSLPSQPTLPTPTSNPSDSPLNLDINVNHELDHDYFRSPPNPANPSSSYKTPRGRPQVPTRSSSIPMPVATLAPPIHSPEGAVRLSPHQSPAQSSKIISNQLTTSPLLENPHEGGEDEILDHTPSHQSLSGSLSSLPGKWVSNLLRAAPQAPGAKSTLESIFHPEDSGTDPSAHASHSHMHSQDPVLDRKPSPSEHYRPSHAHPLPTTQHTLPTFTHANAFAPPPTSSTMSVTHSVSPFAPHTYVPPTGAPGFKGESYTWDSGFSDELEAERKRDLRGENQKAKTLPVPPKTAGRGDAPGQEAAPAKSGWGSGFGFSFGSGRIGKTSSSSSLSPSGSTTAFGRSDGSGTGAENARDADGRGGYERSGGRNASEATDYGRNNKGYVDPKRTSMPNADYGMGGGKGQSEGQDGIGAFIERKVGKVELVGRKASTTPILSSDLAGMIRPSMPALSRLPRSWSLIYSLDQDGISLNTLYARSEAHATRRPKQGEVMINTSAMLVVIKDANGAIFGAWLSEGIRMDKRGKGYYGGGESFLWKYTDSVLKVFKCTGKNHYVTLCDPDYISFGGGDGHYGLYLDETLFDGSSAPCPTFDNEPLCSPGRRKGSSVTFECVGLEVWGLGS